MFRIFIFLSLVTINSVFSQTTTLIKSDSTTIEYQNLLCFSDSNGHKPIVKPNFIGYYSCEDKNLSLNKITGEIIPSKSLPGDYKVVYQSVPNKLGKSLIAQTNITIFDGRGIYITYPLPEYCTSYSGLVPVTISGDSGGNFDSTPAGLSIDFDTGSINPSASLPGYYRVRYTNQIGGCIVINRFTYVTITKGPDPRIDTGIICIDKASNRVLSTAVLDSGLDQSQYIFEWYYNGILIANTSSIIASNIGVYTLTVRASNGCFKTVDMLVNPVYTAEYATLTITGDYFQSQTITVSVFGDGPYQYQLDNGLFQDSPVFTNVIQGSHIITIKDTQGCADIVIKDIYIIDYPKFFTPNADGYNDTWNVWDLKGQDNTIISIFDRYGKLVKQIYPNEDGWDGTFNGIPLPASDYWFYINSNAYKSHFSLKR